MSMHEYLLRIRLLERAIRHKEMRLEQLRACLLPAGIRYDLDRVQTSPADRLAEVSAETIELERQIDVMKAERAHRLIVAGHLIDQLESETDKLVVTAYYIAGEPMARVAEDVQYSVRQTRRIKNRALEKMSQMSAFDVLH